MNYISPKEWLNNYSNNTEFELIDIRENYENIDCPIRSTQIPMEDLAQHPDKISQFKNCVLMCNSGKRAAALTNLLETEYNLQSIYILEGGYVELEKLL